MTAPAGTGPSIDKIIDRVRKMYAKAESARDIGSIAEAEAFAEAVQKTLAAYKLTMSDLSIQQQDAQDPLGRSAFGPQGEGSKRKQKRVWWIEELAQSVASAHYCRLFIHTGSDRLTLVGRNQDREIAQYMIVMLTRLANELCMQGYWKARYVAFKDTGTYNTGDFKESFYRGFVTTISHRYFELREAERRSTNGMALVIRRSDEELTKYVDEIIKPKKSANAIGGRGAHNETGYRAGQAAGRAANLGGKVVNQGAPATSRQLGR